MSRRLAIVQPYIPKYRVPFFNGLNERLNEIDVEMTVLAPLPAGDLRKRGDALASETAWHKVARSHTLELRGHQFTYLGSMPDGIGYDGVIVPGAATYLDGYLALVRKALHRRLRVGWWGHIGGYVKTENRIDVGIESLLMRQMDQVFAYTHGGAAVATSRGVDPEKVTVVQNTIDTQEIERALASLTPEDHSSFSRRFGLRSRTFTYLGGLDRDKGVAAFARALDLLWQLDPDTRVLVLGRGSEEGLLAGAAARSQVIMLGYGDARLKALAAKASEAFVQPGRVGLVAVDALTLQRPIITFQDAMHAPELEYLRQGQDVFFCPSTPGALARYLARFRRDPYYRASAVPTLDEMVTRYARGVSRMLCL